MAWHLLKWLINISLILAGRENNIGDCEYYFVIPFTKAQDPHSTGSFNHAIGLPKKGGIEHDLYDYERLLFNTLETHKHLWVKKATGLGIYRVHVAVYRMAVRKGRLIKMGPNVYCYWP